MQIDHQLSANDMADFQVYWWKKRSKIKPWMLIVLLAMLVSLPQANLLPTHPLVFLYSAGTPFAIIIVFAVWFTPFAARLRARSVPGFLDQRSLRIDTTHIIEKTSISETKLEWKRIQALEETEKCLYFFINNQYGLLLPKRAFNSPSEMQAFLDKSRRYWMAAKSGQAIPIDSGDTWPPPPRIGA